MIRVAATRELGGDPRGIGDSADRAYHGLVGILQPEHLLLIMALVLIVFGAGKLPETFAQLGKGVREFKTNVEGTKPSSSPAASLAAGRHCASCGAAQAEDAVFCATCGAKLAART